MSTDTAHFPASASRPLVTLVLPVYNEAALLADNLALILAHLNTLTQYDFEVLLVNDGSSDGSASIAEACAHDDGRVRVLHHPRNFGVGQAMKLGIANSRGDYVITMDIDLSYDVNHIEQLLEAAQRTRARIVLASPFLKGGAVRNVPALRRILSVLGNRFLSFFVRGRFSTLTCMVRLYDGPFVRALRSRAMGMDSMPETLYKSMVLRASIEEIPARLDWGVQAQYGARQSSMRVVNHVRSTIMSGFIFRPFLFMTIPGLLLGLFAAWLNFWMFAHFFDALAQLRLDDPQATWSAAVAQAYASYPHTFVLALFATLLAVQLMGLGLLALQNKRYFEELYYLGADTHHALAVPMDEQHSRVNRQALEQNVTRRSRRG